MTQTATEREMPRLKARYRSELQQRLKDELELGNIMQVPRPLKVVVNMGIGEAIREARLLDGAVRDLTQITGQKPLVTRAKKSIAGFKVREGQSIGAKVTLRGDRMWEFLDRLISIAIPRVRDFRGLPTRHGELWRQPLGPGAQGRARPDTLVLATPTAVTRLVPGSADTSDVNQVLTFLHELNVTWETP